MNIKSVGIVGYGNFGKFLRHLIRRFTSDVTVLQYDAKVPLGNDLLTSMEKVASCDVIVLAVPFEAFEQTLCDLLRFSGHGVIVDVSTIKSHPVKLLRKYAQHRRYIATHPMFGPESYEQRKGNVSGFRIVVCDHCRLHESELHLAQHFLQRLGFQLVKMGWQAHDMHLAETLFLTHYVGQIVNRGGFNRTEIDTVSFGNLMSAVESVAHDTKLFTDVFKYLPDECRSVIERYEAAVGTVHNLLKEFEPA